VESTGISRLGFGTEDAWKIYQALNKLWWRASDNVRHDPRVNGNGFCRVAHLFVRFPRRHAQHAGATVSNQGCVWKTELTLCWGFVKKKKTQPKTEEKRNDKVVATIYLETAFCSSSRL